MPTTSRLSPHRRDRLSMKPPPRHRPCGKRNTGRRKAQTRRRSGASPWEGMGAGFTDQGFAEHFFALQNKNLYSVSHRTCKLKYVHFNMPCFETGRRRLVLPRTQLHCQKHAAYRESDEVDLRWGGHRERRTVVAVRAPSQVLRAALPRRGGVVCTPRTRSRRGARSSRTSMRASRQSARTAYGAPGRR